MTELFCSMCNYTTDKEEHLVYHIIRKHQHEKNFRVNCTAKSCYYSSKSWTGFRSHYSRKHRKSIDESYIEEARNDENFLNSCGVSTGEKSLEMQCASFALTLMSKHKLPESSVNDVIESTANFLLFSEEIRAHNPNINIYDHLTEFKTAKRREAFFKKSCSYIPPQEVVLGQTTLRKKGMLKRVNDCGYIVPFEKSLQNYLNQAEVWEEICHERPVSAFMEDFCDGAFAADNVLLQEHPNCLQFLLNTDSLEVVNPIGSHTKKHKIDVFYWTLANIRPFMRSKWTSIHLLGICKTKHLKKHGTAKFLKDFVDSLKNLQHGIRMQICGKETTVHGILTAIMADTPAAAFITDMKQSSSFAKKGCRTCNIKTPDMQNHIKLSDLQERCPDIHRERCTNLETMPEHLKPFWSKQWGINGTCPFLVLPYFNPAQCTPHDPMHVCLEGVFNYGTALILQLGLESKLFTLNWLNSKIQNFYYSYLDRDNKPEEITRPQIFDLVTLKQTAAGILTLNYILPYILQEKFDDFDRYYKNYMHLVAIVGICCSPYCTADTAGDLQVLVEGYLHDFKRLYPTKPLRPKHHFLLHLPLQILRFGPLRNQWLFRFESKNNSFKHFKIHNFINLPYSLTKYHQLSACYSLLGSDGLPSENHLYSGDGVKEGNTINFQEVYPQLATDFVGQISKKQDFKAYETTEIIMHGQTYRPGACLLTDWENTTPKFSKIEKLFVYDYTKFAVCHCLETQTFEWTSNSFHVEETNIWQIVILKNLMNKWPIPLYQINGKSMICNRYSHLTQGLF